MTKSPTDPLIRWESYGEPWRESARTLPAAEVAQDESDPEPSGSKPNPAPTPIAEAEPRAQFEPSAKPQPEPSAKPQPEPDSGQRTLPAEESGWSRPTQQEIEAANEPRHYHLPAGAIMSLTIDSMGIYGAPVFDSAGPMALAKGVAHLPDTSLPWSQTPQRNVYLAGHPWVIGERGAA